MLQQTPQGPFFTLLSYKLLAQEQRVENMKMSDIRWHCYAWCFNV